MKKLLIVMTLLFASSTSAQYPTTSFTAGGNITAASASCLATNCVPIKLPASATTLTVGVTGTFSATLAVEESQDGGRTWTSAGSNITGAGTTSFTITAFSDFRVRASAYVSGNAGVNILVSASTNSGGGGVSALNTLTGAVTLAAGTNVTLTPSGNTITIASTGGGGSSQIVNGVSCTGCKADLQAVYDATVTNGSTAITTGAGDIPFTAADTGKTCYATSGGGPNGTNIPHLSGKLATGSGIAGEGTFTFLTAHTGTCSVAGNANATGTNTNYFFWATNDSAAMTTAYALANPATGLCSTLILPARPFFVDTNFGSGVGTTCQVRATGAGNEGLSVFGFGQLSSLMTVGPNFDPSTCGAYCFFNGAGISLYNFGIWGSERGDCPAGFNGKSLLGVGPDFHFVNITGVGWCSNSSGQTVNVTGILINHPSGAEQTGNIFDGFGSQGAHVSTNDAPFSSSWFGSYDTYDVSLDAGMTWVSTGNNFGDVNNNSTMVVVNGTLKSTNDYCFKFTSGLNNAGIQAASGGILKATNLSCDLSSNSTSLPVWASAGKVTLVNSSLKGGASKEDLLIDTSGTAYASVTDFLGTTTAIKITAPGTYFDRGGNAYTGSVANILPTCVFTTGGGTTPSCTLQSGSTNEKGTIIATTGTGAPGSTGTITLTFAGTFTGGTATTPTCQVTIDNSGTAWGAEAVTQMNTQSTTAPILNWTNIAALTATPLAVSSPFRIGYSCTAR